MCKWRNLVAIWRDTGWGKFEMRQWGGSETVQHWADLFNPNKYLCNSSINCFYHPTSDNPAGPITSSWMLPVAEPHFFSVSARLLVEIHAQKANSHHPHGVMSSGEFINQFVCGIYEGHYDPVTLYHASCSFRAARSLGIQLDCIRCNFRYVLSYAWKRADANAPVIRLYSWNSR